LFGTYAYGKPSKYSDIGVIVSNRIKSISIYLNLAMTLFEYEITPVDLPDYKKRVLYLCREKGEQSMTYLCISSGKRRDCRIEPKVRCLGETGHKDG
jgi:predicted nucleotidyltransferase